MCVCIYIYIYIYVFRERERDVCTAPSTTVRGMAVLSRARLQLNVSPAASAFRELFVLPVCAYPFLGIYELISRSFILAHFDKVGIYY